MKTTITVIFILAVMPGLTAGIVNNSTVSPTAEDSLSVIFYSLDSLGNADTADSIYILVSGPGGIVYRDSSTIADGRVTAGSICDKTIYTFCEQVSNIDGDGWPGQYAMTILAGQTAADLLTPNIFEFQIVSRDFSDQIALIGDSVLVRGGEIDANRAVDSASMAAWVWNAPQADHTETGTFGKYLDSEISGIGSGSGACAVTMVAFDRTVGQVIPHVSLAVRNLDQSALIATGRTDINGRAGFNLDNGDFTVSATASGYLFAAFDTLSIAGAGTDTIFCDQFDPGLPNFPLLCRVYGHIFDAGGVPEEDVRVTAWLPSGVTTFGPAIIAPKEIATATDSTGYFYLDLIPSDSLAADDARYEFTFDRDDGSILRKRIEVPDSTSWRMTW